jgi:transposase
MLLLPDMPAARVCGALRIGHSAITRIMRYWVEKAVDEDDLSDVESLCIDETSHCKGQSYVTVVIDPQTRRVIDVEEGRGSNTVEAFAGKLEQKGGSCDRVRFMVSDMSEAYLKGREDWFPKAISVIDKFHVKKLLLERMEEVRRAEAGLSKYSRKTIAQKKLMMIPSGKLTAEQAEKVEALSKSYPKTGRAWRMVEALDILYSSATMQHATKKLGDLISWMRRSRLEPMKKAALTLKQHREKILAYFLNKLTNALAEGINSLIQAAKRKARGFPTFRGFSCMIYLIVGKLRLACGSPFL